MPKESTTAEATEEKPVDTRTAKIRTLKSGVKAKNFTFGKGQVVPGVSFAYAEYLRDRGEAEIIEVTA